MAKDEQLSVRIQHTLKELAEQRAASLGLTVSGFVRSTLEQAVENLDWRSLKELRSAVDRNLSSQAKLEEIGRHVDALLKNPQELLDRERSTQARNGRGGSGTGGDPREPGELFRKAEVRPQACSPGSSSNSAAFSCGTGNRPERQDLSSGTLTFKYEVYEPHDSMGRPSGATVYRFVGYVGFEVEWIIDFAEQVLIAVVVGTGRPSESLGLPPVTRLGQPIKGTNASDYEWPNYSKGQLRIVTSGPQKPLESHRIWKVILPKQPSDGRH